MAKFDDRENGFEEYKRLILADLKRLEVKIEGLDTRLLKIDIDLSELKRLAKVEDNVAELQVGMAKLQVKASMWGGLAGLIPVLLYVVFRVIGGK